MYGTVAHLRQKPGQAEAALQAMREQEGEMPSSMVAAFAFRSDSDPDEVIIVGIFDSKEAYQANAATPEQTRRFERMQSFAAGPPQWHDGEVVWSHQR